MLMGMPPDGLVSLLVIPLVATVGFVALIAISRGLRRIYRWVAGRLGRWIGPRAARAVGWTAVVTGTALLISGVLLDGLVAAADAAFSVRNGTTEAGVVQTAAMARVRRRMGHRPATARLDRGRRGTPAGDVAPDG